ncbi:MAG TPA: formylglycine-generating enzyme family protein [Stellaceae bacterium]|nr:formylglycine-generating enzyme family protein [Stellaceae bacterium]
MARLQFVLLALFLLADIFVVLHAASAEERPDREFRECTKCPEMVAIPAGKFVMGSPATERGRFDDEGPQHTVSVRAFALGKYDVTNAEFLTFLRDTAYQPKPCDRILVLSWKSPGHGLAYPPGLTDPPLEPAACLNWNDAQAYIAWLNGKARSRDPSRRYRDGPYRLPSEAEWEYAARAGTTAARWWGHAIGRGNANCDGCGSQWDDKLIAPVGSFAPNPFGLYDMLGNVWQWVEDCWNDSYVGAPTDGSAWTTGDCSKRVLRGGSWSNLPVFIRAATRSRADAAGGDFDYSSYAGFRVARTLP